MVADLIGNDKVGCKADACEVINLQWVQENCEASIKRWLDSIGRLRCIHSVDSTRNDSAIAFLLDWSQSPIFPLEGPDEARTFR